MSMLARTNGADLRRNQVVLGTEHGLQAFVSELRNGVANCKSIDPDRIASTMTMLDALDMDFPKEKYDVIIHRVDGRASGALVLEKSDPAKVLVMATHPDSKGVGSALMEQAVNLAKDHTGKAKLHLEVMDDAAAAAYKKMGFLMSKVSASDSDADSDSDSDITCEPMILNASKAVNWIEDGGGGMRMANRKPPHFVD